MTRSVPRSCFGGVAGDLCQLLLRGVSEGWATSRREIWGEASRLRLPVADQRGRDAPAARGAAFCRRPAALLPQQGGEDLDRLAESHVVGQAGADAELGAEPEPVQSGQLVVAKLALEAGGRRADRARRACAGRRASRAVRSPASTSDHEPCSSIAPLVLQVGGGAGEQAHPLDEGDAVASRLLFDLLPMVERLLQLLAVDLDPFAPQQDQAVWACSGAPRPPWR